MNFILLFQQTVLISMVFLFGCTGEIIMEKSGHLNLGIPGVMCMGTFGGCFGVSIFMGMNSADPGNANFFGLIFMSLLFSAIFSLLAGLIYGFLTVTLKSNQNVTGLALTTFGAGIADFFMNKIDKTYFAQANKIFVKTLPFSSSTGVFGELFLSYSLLTYVAIVIAILIAVLLKRTRFGLNLRAVGENPSTADAVGINVTKYKYSAILLGSVISGFGGLYYVMNYGGGTWENSSTIQAFGWLSIALVIFVVWKPTFAILGSLIFGFLFILPNYIEVGTNFALMEILDMAAYVTTIIVLIITSIIGKRSVQPPQALGQSYFREER